MKTYRIVWRPAAQAQLLALHQWIADQAGAATADGYADALLAHLAGFATFPDRGTARDDLHPGLRTTPFRRRTVIAWRVREDEVEIVALVHGGQMLGGPFED